MSTHNIGSYEDLTKLSSNTHLISSGYGRYSNHTHFKAIRYIKIEADYKEQSKDTSHICKDWFSHEVAHPKSLMPVFLTIRDSCFWSHQCSIFHEMAWFLNS